MKIQWVKGYQEPVKDAFEQPLHLSCSKQGEGDSSPPE